VNQEDIEKMNNWKTKVIDTFNTYANVLGRSSKKDNTSELFDVLFDDTADNDIREEIIVNMAYIINCSILESYETDYTKLFDEIYHNILDVYFERYSCIELTKNDRRIIAGIILTILNRLHRKLACRSFTFDDLFIDNKKEDSNPLHDILRYYIEDTNGDDCSEKRIRRSIINIIEGLYYPDCPYEFSILPVEILGRMNFFQEFWVEPEKHVWQMLVILMAFILLGVYLWLKSRLRKRTK